MSSSGNTIGILVPQPSAPAMVSQGSANPPEPLTNAAGPVDVIEMVADVASSALSLVAPDSAAANVADAVSDVVSLASMVPGLPSVRLPSRKMVSGFGGGSGAGSDGGVVTSGHGHCIPCKVAAAIGNPVNAVLGIKVLFDDTETDFSFDSPLPLVWQRSYYSDQIGNGWLGQGWSLPFSMRLVRTADGFLYIDEQGREISLPDISDEADEPYSAADDDEDDLYEEEAAQRPASAEEDPYGLDNAYFDPYEQIFFSQISDDLYQIASPDGGARLLFAEVDSGCGIFQLVAQLDRNGNLTAVYGRDGKKNCTVSPTATTSWLNTASPTDWCPATDTTVTTPTAKCSKAATTSAKNGRSTTAKTIPSLPTHWDRSVRFRRKLGT